MDKNVNQRQSTPGPNTKSGSPYKQERKDQSPYKKDIESPASGNSGAAEQYNESEQRVQSDESRGPVTNQDEQHKTTNAGNASDPIGELETEGD